MPHKCDPVLMIRIEQAPRDILPGLHPEAYPEGVFSAMAEKMSGVAFFLSGNKGKYLDSGNDTELTTTSYPPHKLVRSAV